MEDNRYDYYNKPKKEKRKIGIIGALIIALIGGLVGGSIGYFAAAESFLKAPQPQTSVSENSGTEKIIVNKTENPVSAVASKAMPSIVGISTVMKVQDSWAWFNTEREVPATGSGIIVDPRGYILTNAHVVNDGEVTSCQVMLDDGTYVDGKVIWTDKSIDVAFVKIETDHKLIPATLGDSDKVNVGDLAVAIGNPIDPAFQRSVTAGVISGLNRVVGQVSGGGYMTGLIQTDAAINGGNSGGALLNDKGEVIGMNTVKVQTAEGLGFSIPINSIRPIIDEVLKTGTYNLPVLGIDQYDARSAQMIMRKDLGVENGVLVINVYKGSPAEEAGIKPGDIIVKMGGMDIMSMDSLKVALYKEKVGDTTKVTVFRDGKNVDLEVTFTGFQVSDAQRQNKDTFTYK